MSDPLPDATETPPPVFGGGPAAAQTSMSAREVDASAWGVGIGLLLVVLALVGGFIGQIRDVGAFQGAAVFGPDTVWARGDSLFVDADTLYVAGDGTLRRRVLDPGTRRALLASSRTPSNTPITLSEGAVPAFLRDADVGPGDTLRFQDTTLFVQQNGAETQVGPLTTAQQQTVRRRARPVRSEASSFIATTTYVRDGGSEPISQSLLLCLIAIVGALAASLHGVQSLVEFVGNGDYRRRWVMWYLARPLVGGILAVIVHFLVVGNLSGVGSQIDLSTNLEGVYTALGVAALVGLFSKQAMYKLGDVFDTVFQSDRDTQLRDGLQVTPVIDDVSTSDGQVTIVGAGFPSDARVFLGDQQLRTTRIDPGYIEAVLPPNRASAAPSTWPTLTVQGSRGERSAPYSFDSTSPSTDAEGSQDDSPGDEDSEGEDPGDEDTGDEGSKDEGSKDEDSTTGPDASEDEGEKGRNGGGGS